MRASLLSASLLLTASCLQENPAVRPNEPELVTYAAVTTSPPPTIAGIHGFALLPDGSTGARVVGATMLIRTASVTLEVDSLDAAIGFARAAAVRFGGYAAGYDRNVAASWRPQASLHLRVPVEHLDAAVDALTALGRAEAVQLLTQDVSEEFVDVTARLENARLLERRLLALLASRTGKLADVVQVEEKLAQVREEIERIEGRRRFLATRSAISAIELTLHEAGIPARAPLWGDAADAAGLAWRNFTGLVALLIAASGLVVPLGVLATLVWVVGRRVYGRRNGALLATIGGSRTASE